MKPPALSKSDPHTSIWADHTLTYTVDLLSGSRLPVAEKIGSAGLLAGCHVDLLVHAALNTICKNALAMTAANPTKRWRALAPEERYL
jgi:hypothetical protein